jgi:RHH-type proline utilization regulon transcriptional repressor/proline dehydrogenase/delta 1-pyrroline-5-carboxylate dehydrogenase
VVYKPSGLSSVIGRGLVDLFQEAGRPAGVFNYTPGRGSVIGDHLVDHPDVAVIAFTGSVEVGLRIQERAAKVHPGQVAVQEVIRRDGRQEHAIIIDDDADLDEAVSGVLYSAFGFQGQNGSPAPAWWSWTPSTTASVSRLKEAALSVKIGPSDDPANFMGPVWTAPRAKTS